MTWQWIDDAFSSISLLSFHLQKQMEVQRGPAATLYVRTETLNHTSSLIIKHNTLTLGSCVDTLIERERESEESALSSDVYSCLIMHLLIIQECNLLASISALVFTFLSTTLAASSTDDRRLMCREYFQVGDWRFLRSKFSPCTFSLLLFVFVLCIWQCILFNHVQFSFFFWWCIDCCIFIN